MFLAPLFVSHTNCQTCHSNWGTESDPDFKYHNGNSDPRGFGMTLSLKKLLEYVYLHTVYDLRE